MTSEKGSGSYLSPSSMSPVSSGSSSTQHQQAPPPYRFHHLPHTPSSSKPPSRSNTPPLHGGSIHLHPSERFSFSKAPITMQRIVGILIRRWKTVLFIVTFGTLAAFGMFGAMWTEWREMTYYR